jgi:hypothetical protein
MAICQTWNYEEGWQGRRHPSLASDERSFATLVQKKVLPWSIQYGKPTDQSGLPLHEGLTSKYMPSPAGLPLHQRADAWRRQLQATRPGPSLSLSDRSCLSEASTSDTPAAGRPHESGHGVIGQSSCLRHTNSYPAYPPMTHQVIKICTNAATVPAAFSPFWFEWWRPWICVCSVLPTGLWGHFVRMDRRQQVHLPPQHVSTSSSSEENYFLCSP